MESRDLYLLPTRVGINRGQNGVHGGEATFSHASGDQPPFGLFVAAIIHFFPMEWG